MEKKLYRNTANKMIVGVCAGLADYFKVDATIVRLIWVLLSFFGPGVIAYIIAALIIPEKPSDIIDV